MRTRDPETSYIGINWLGYDYGSEVRCRRCGGRGMWPTPKNSSIEDNDKLCLRCADDWMESDLLEKHGYVWSRKKWQAAFDEFCHTKPKDVDIHTHNRRIESEDSQIHTMLPQYFTKEEGEL